MSKLALLSLMILTITPCLAADNSAVPSNSSASTAPTSAGKGANGGHSRAFGKRPVLDLSSLTDKQKQQINAVYDGNKPQWEALQKQMRELHEAEWAKVKVLLTPEQISELQSERHRRGKGAAAEKETATESN